MPSYWSRGPGHPHCGTKGHATCNRPNFVCGSISEFHTQRLEDATREINAMLKEVAKDDKDRPPGADLSILETPDGPFLSWTWSSDEGVAIDNEDEIRKFLGTYDCPPDEQRDIDLNVEN